MKMLSDKQIKFYLKMIESKSAKARKKAESRLKNDLEKFGAYRVEICKKMYSEMFGGSDNVK